MRMMFSHSLTIGRNTLGMNTFHKSVIQGGGSQAMPSYWMPELNSVSVLNNRVTPLLY